jgi:hypothetical protein
MDLEYKYRTGVGVRSLAEKFFGDDVHKIYVASSWEDFLVLREIEAALAHERAERKALTESLHRERALRQAAESALWACSKQLAEARDQISQDPPRCHIRQSLAEARLQEARDDLAARLKLQEGLYGEERLANSRLVGALAEVIRERDDLRSALEQAENKLDRVRGAVEALKALGLDLEAKMG